MFFTIAEFLRNPSRALQSRIRCCQIIMDLKKPIDPAWHMAQSNQSRAAFWLAVLARVPGGVVEVPGLVLFRWEKSSEYLTLRSLRDEVRATWRDA